MMRQLFLVFFLSSLIISSLEGGYTIYKGKLINSDDVPEYSAQKHYELALAAMESGDYLEATKHFNIISINYSYETFTSDSLYYLGACYFELNEYDFANDAFSNYIKCESQPRYFESAITYKLEIAKCFQNGAKKRFFGTKMLPKWAPARVLAVEIYNEIISALPCHELAAQALWSKAHLHWDDCDFRESVEAFQQLIRRFPKHELAPCSYVNINAVYLSQANVEFQNPDLLVFAQINLRRFQKDFPKDERLEDAANDVQAIKELYAKGLFETGQFYERKEKPEASAIYYKSAIEQFPDTNYAKCCRRRLSIILNRNITQEIIGEECFQSEQAEIAS